MSDSEFVFILSRILLNSVKNYHLNCTNIGWKRWYDKSLSETDSLASEGLGIGFQLDRDWDVPNEWQWQYEDVLVSLSLHALYGEPGDIRSRVNRYRLRAQYSDVNTDVRVYKQTIVKLTEERMEGTGLISHSSLYTEVQTAHWIDYTRSNSLHNRKIIMASS